MPTPRRRPGISPGPSWAILSEPATSSPSTRTNIHSDTDFDLDADMGDDESEHEPEHEPEHAPISKRKAPTDELGSARKPRKLPRLDPNGSASTHRVTSSSSGSASPSKSRDTAHASRTQPAQKFSKKPISLERLRTSRDESTSSGTSTTSDFPQRLSQWVQKANARDKEKEKETTRTQGSMTTRRGPPVTARKQTTQVKNVRKVTTANLLRNAQNPSDPMDQSRSWTRIRPKGKQKRTNFDEEMGRSRPLAVARERIGNTIELTDSSDSTRRPRPSQPSTTNGPRPSVLLDKGDPIIITSGSEDDHLPAMYSTQRRRSGPSGTQGKGASRKGVPPPVDVEVISILDSDEDVGTSGAALRPPEASAAQASTSRPNPPPSPSRRSPAAPPPAPKAVTALTPTTPVSTSTRLPELSPSRPQDTQQQDSGTPSSPSCGPPPDDFDDAFGNMDFGTTGDDVNPSGALNGWDSFDVGPPLVTVPTSVSSEPAVAGGGMSMSVPEDAEDELGPDALFDSYVNMDLLEGDVDHEMVDGAPLERGNEAEERAVENGVTNGLEASAPEQPPASRSENGPNLDGDRNGDVRIRDLEEGEVDPNEAPPLSTRFPETPESGEIGSQDLSQLPTQPGVARLAQTSTLARLPSSAPVSPRSSASAKSALQPLERTSTLVMPDISLYKGVRFKRPFPGARENSFFSRALNGAARSGKAIESVGEGNEQREGDGSASGGVSAPVEVLSSVGGVQNLDGDADMQDDSAVLMPGPSKASNEAVVPTPPPVPATTRRRLDGSGRAKYTLYSTGPTTDCGANYSSVYPTDYVLYPSNTVPTTASNTTHGSPV
ncbi:hypothetical protein EV363DRAFT_54573 [Boletus edulis]|nr:hypothetical protein EV363DRAFT_54573 [Boletus edulis]